MNLFLCISVMHVTQDKEFNDRKQEQQPVRFPSPPLLTLSIDSQPMNDGAACVLATCIVLNEWQVGVAGYCLKGVRSPVHGISDGLTFFQLARERIFHDFLLQ
jgi:hypothetical protein